MAKLKHIHLRAMQSVVGIYYFLRIYVLNSIQLSLEEHSSDETSDALAGIDSAINKWLEETPDHCMILCQP
jgi:hypothetical protein